jgi:hypothetical protein
MEIWNAGTSSTHDVYILDPICTFMFCTCTKLHLIPLCREDNLCTQPRERRVDFAEVEVLVAQVQVHPLQAIHRLTQKTRIVTVAAPTLQQSRNTDEVTRCHIYHDVSHIAYEYHILEKSNHALFRNTVNERLFNPCFHVKVSADHTPYQLSCMKLCTICYAKGDRIACS